jgi:hypothetical protein
VNRRKDRNILDLLCENELKGKDIEAH